MTMVAEPDVRTPPGRSARDWVLLAIPQVILGGGMLVMLVAHPNAVKSGLMSTRAILVNTGLLVGWLLLSFVILPRVVRNVVLRSAILTALAVVGVVVLVVPTLHDTKVVEKFPGIASAPREEPTVTTGATSAEPAAPAPTAAPQPVKVSSGTLRGIDHDATGNASVFRQPDGRFVVALEDIDVEPGPDYYVWVVPGRDRRSPGDGTELAKLRGNQGTQYYEVPRGTSGEIGAEWTVLIWCRAFGVPIANATQA